MEIGYHSALPCLLALESLQKGQPLGWDDMIDNEENPYTTSPETTYRWGRSRCLGGRTLHWARATDRMAAGHRARQVDASEHRDQQHHEHRDGVERLAKAQ